MSEEAKINPIDQNVQKPDDVVSKDQILLVALNLFTKKGYFNTSLSDIGEEASISHKQIYQHFKTKQDIATTLYHTILGSLESSIDEISRHTSKTHEQLNQIVGLMFGLADEAPEVLSFLLFLKHDEFIKDANPQFTKGPFEKLKSIFQTGITSGDIRKIEPLQAYAQFFGIVQLTLKLILSGTLESKAEKYQVETFRSAWNAIASHR